jgi:hypothetical protein
MAFLKDIIFECGIDSIGIQETMLKTFSHSFLRHLGRCGNFKWHWLASRGRSGGILGGLNLERFDNLNFSIGFFI